MANYEHAKTRGGYVIVDVSFINSNESSGQSELTAKEKEMIINAFNGKKPILIGGCTIAGECKPFNFATLSGGEEDRSAYVASSFYIEYDKTYPDVISFGKL